MLQKSSNKASLPETVPQRGSAAVRKFAIVVLGMHRSGTSALAGTLHHLGAELPQTLMKASDSNPKGYYESSSIQTFNDRLLQAADSSWKDWQPLNADWFASPPALRFEQEAKELLTQEFGDSNFFLLKDPRLCRLFPFWSKILTEMGVEPFVVHTHRNPMEVAESLLKRDGIPTSEGLLIWLRHVLEAERSSRNHPRYFTKFEDVLQDWMKVAKEVQKELSLTLPRLNQNAASEIDTFLSSDLKHFSIPPEKILENELLPEWVRESFAILEGWVGTTGTRQADRKRLTKIKNALDTATPAFTQLLRPLNDLKKEVAASRKASSEYLAKITTLEGEIANLQRDQAAATAGKQQLDKSHAEIKQALQELQQEKHALSEKLADATAEIETATSRQADLTRSRDESRLEITTLNAQCDTLSREKKDLADSLRTKVEDMDALSEKLSQIEADLDKKTHSLSQTESALRQRQLESEEGAEEIKQLKAERDVLSDQLRQAQFTADANQATISRQQQELSVAKQSLAETKEKQQEISALKDLLKRTQATLKALEQEHSDKVADLARAAAEVDRQGQELARTKDALQAQEQDTTLAREELERQYATLTETRHTLATQEQYTSETRANLSRVTTSLNEKTHQIAQLEAENATNQQDAASLTKMIMETRTALENQKKHSEHVRNTLMKQSGDIGAERAHMHAQIDALTAEVEAMRGSSSWKLTKPLRVLKNVLRRG